MDRMDVFLMDHLKLPEEYNERIYAKTCKRLGGRRTG